MAIAKRVVLVCVLFLVCGLFLLGKPRHTDAATTRPSKTEPDLYSPTLITKHFVITIIYKVNEGRVDDDHVIYVGVSRRTGKSIRLVGKIWYSTRADGTPIDFYGYIFRNGDTSYRGIRFGNARDSAWPGQDSTEGKRDMVQMNRRDNTAMEKLN